MTAKPDFLTATEIKLHLVNNLKIKHDDLDVFIRYLEGSQIVIYLNGRSRYLGRFSRPRTQQELEILLENVRLTIMFEY